MYGSSPPLPGIYRPFYLLPSAHAPPKPNLEESYSMESYIDSSDIEFGRAEDGEAAGDDEGGERSPSPSEGTQGGSPERYSVSRAKASKRFAVCCRQVCFKLFIAIEKFSSTCFS